MSKMPKKIGQLFFRGNISTIEHAIQLAANFFLVCDIIYDDMYNNSPITWTMIQKLVDSMRNVNNDRHLMKVVRKTQI